MTIDKLSSSPIAHLDMMQFSDAPKHLQPLWDNFFVLLHTGVLEILKAWEEKDLTQLSARAHCYKGQVMMFQYHSFKHIFSMIEANIANKQLDKIEQHLLELQLYYQQEVQRYEKYKDSDR